MDGREVDVRSVSPVPGTQPTHNRVNDQISDTRLIRIPAQPIRKTWGSGLSMITYLSPYEDCAPGMVIEVPPVLVYSSMVGRFNYSSDRPYVDVLGQLLAILCEVLPLPSTRRI